jgi:uncharacterized membrane protein (UPF0127 family)
MAAVSSPLNGLLGVAILIVSLAVVLTASGCDETDSVSADVLPVKIAGHTFHLEIAADDAKRMKGLGGRTEITFDGGMIFAFTPSQTRVQSFVMRDCPMDIDILYLDGAGRVLTMYTMKAEPPRNDDGSEGKNGDLDNFKYESRLKKYPSRFPSTFVVELAGGTIQKIGVKEGDQLVFDVASLKRRAR